jgi:hypothetical protein
MPGMQAAAPVLAFAFAAPSVPLPPQAAPQQP